MDQPKFASCILLELHEIDGSYFVKIFYKNTPTDDVPPLVIPNCGTKCPLEKFSELYGKIINVDLKIECGTEN